MSCKRYRIWLAAILAAALFTGCGSQPAEDSAESAAAAESTSVSEDAEGIAATETTGESSETAGSDSAEIADLFSDRDLDPSYNEEDAVTITLADEKTTAGGDGVSVSGQTVTISEGGVYVVSGSLSEGQIVVDVDKEEKVQLVLNGVSITNSSSAAIYVLQADKVFLTLAEGSENTLSTTGEFVAIDDNNIDAVIFSKEDLTLNGTGSLTIDCAAGHGIVSKDDLKVTGGSYQITAAKHGLQGKDSIRIYDGSLTIDCGKDGLHAENADDDSLGWIFICGGTFSIEAEDDGMHANNTLTILDGTINVTNSYEGLEGHDIVISGGTISLVSDDDGLNAAGGNDGSGFEMPGMGDPNAAEEDDAAEGDRFSEGDTPSILISGGVITVDASGDGLDSNGTLTVTGGEVYVSGPEGDGDGAIDCDGEAQITGGIVVAAGSSGMAQNFGSSSTQGSMLVTLSGEAGTEISLTDENGTTLVSCTPAKAFACVVISCPDIQTGETYTVTAGDQSTTVEMTELQYGTGGMNSFGGEMGGGDGMPGGGDAGLPENAEPPEGMEPPSNGTEGQNHA